MFRKQFHHFGVALEGGQLPVGGDKPGGHFRTRPERYSTERADHVTGRRSVVTYLMSSMVRRAELQTMRRGTEFFSVCCFWTLAHLGQTERREEVSRLRT